MSLVVNLMLAAAVAAQGPPPDLWRHGATATVAGGAASASSDTAAHTSASIGWEIGPRLGLDGTAFWFDRLNGGDAFAGTLSLQVNLLAPHRAVPFVQAGFGMYHAAFDASHHDLPSFYADRLPTGARAAALAIFTDPVSLVGGGVSVFVTGHLAVRPEASLLLVTRQSHAYAVTTVGIRAVYHFEEHPVSSSQRRP